jgi:hypothetical protein
LLINFQQGRIFSTDGRWNGSWFSLRYWYSHQTALLSFGAEANYTVHNLKFEDSEMDLGGVMDYKYKYMNLTVTYSF